MTFAGAKKAAWQSVRGPEFVEFGHINPGYQTVRKVIRGQATEFKYERGVQPAPKLGEWVEVLTEILEKEAKLPRRERRSTQRLFEELRGRGYDGAHDSVHRFVKGWRNERARVPVHAYVPMSFAPGEAYSLPNSHELLGVQELLAKPAE